MWCVSMSVIVLAQDGNPLRTGAVGPFLMLCLVLSCVSCTYALWFLQARGVPLFMWCECYCYKFCRKVDNGLLKFDFICLTSDSLMTNVSLKPLHVVLLQLYIFIIYKYNYIQYKQILSTVSVTPSAIGYLHELTSISSQCYIELTFPLIRT